MHIFRRVVANAGMVVLGIALALLLGEAMARLRWREPPPIPPNPPAPALPELRGSLKLMKRNVEGIHRGVYYRTNSAGFRGREYDKIPPPGTFRIAIAGDSFTMGQGVLEEQAYPQLLERALNAASRKTRFEVLNLGIGGLDIHKVVSRLERVGLPYEPDLIVYGCTWNDIRNNAYRESMGNRPLDAQREIYERFADSPSYLLRAMWPRWKSLQELLSPQPGTMVFEVLDNYFNNPPAWRGFTSGLDRLATIRDRDGIPVVVFIHTSLSYLNIFHPFRAVYGAIGEAAEARDMATIQSLHEFRGWSPESLWVNEIDFHPNQLGHRLLAKALLRGLRPHLPDLADQ